MPFLKRDIRNLYGRVKKLLGLDDANKLMCYMKTAKEENNIFQYEFTDKEESKIYFGVMLKVMNGTKIW